MVISCEILSFWYQELKGVQSLSSLHYAGKLTILCMPYGQNKAFLILPASLSCLRDPKLILERKKKKKGKNVIL